jgi:uncharacterized Fe-S cluster-containing radical SAM superfamily protein
MLSPDQIRAELRKNIIWFVQLDPNGICNCRCWYCPVAYGGNPKGFQHIMTLEEFRCVLDRLEEAKGALIDPGLSEIWMAHYNETLLHPSWFLLYEELARRGLSTITFTNGLPLTPKNVRMLEDLTPKPNTSIRVNCPAADPETWSKLTGRPAKLFDQILENLTALAGSAVLAPRSVIHVNTVLPGETRLALGAKVPLSPSELIANGTRAAEAWKSRFPNLAVQNMPLIDRAESMPEVLVEKRKLAYPTGCGHIRPGGRNFAGLHISATGELFLCCMDYHMEYRYGNLLQTPLRELWGSAAHVAMLDRSLREICARCSYAIYDGVTLPPELVLGKF